MKNQIIRSSLLLILIGIGILYGYIIGENRIFPYRIIKATFNKISSIGKSYGPYSIGIYEGNSPLNLSDLPGIENPVLTGKDVSDIDASFIADPFMINKGKQYFMFFEVWNKNTKQGDIGYAVSSNLMDWDYKKIVLDEEFHLSYPNIIYWENSYYLIPESGKDLSVKLYRASKFPEEWEFVTNILSGYKYLDPSIFRYNNKWWMFVATGESNILNLYYSDDLMTRWRSHPVNPIVKFNPHYARPSGKVITFEGKLYRFAQDDYPTYGTQVFAFEIIELTDSTFKEKLVSENPILTKSGKGWNKKGMHHLDLHQIDGRWISIVDGNSYVIE